MIFSPPPPPPSGTVTNTCPAPPMSTGRPGLRGTAAPSPAAEASNHVAGPVRTETSVPGVVRYVTKTHKNPLTRTQSHPSPSLIVQELSRRHLMRRALMKCNI